MKRRLVALLCTAAMVTGALSGCTGSGSQKPAPGATQTSGDTGSGENGSTDPSADMGDEVSLEFFDVAANYQGDQIGWFAKVLKDNVNVKINIIAPQVAGDEVYQTRASGGNLGDVLILEKTQWQDCVANGLVKDVTADLYKYPNLAAYQDQIDTLNQSLDGNDGKLYGIPTEMMNTSPTSYSQNVIYSMPQMRWDLYKGLGCPEIKDLDGMLDVLEEMQATYPTNDAGDPCYAFSLWPDWDGGDGMLGIANIVQLMTWYNEKPKGSMILEPDGSMIPLTDKNGGYYKFAKFLNNAYHRGLVDPDSGTQDWNSACAKMSAGQVYLFWYSWQQGFWNSADRMAGGQGMTFIPVQDQSYFADADSYYGSGRVWAIGSQVDDAKYQRILQLLDYLASPEGLEYQHTGIEGFNYEKQADGKYKQLNSNALMDNLPVPEEWGGGGYSDGNNAINQWLVAAISTNPNTGEPYTTQYWQSYLDETNVGTRKEWSEQFGATDAVDWMKQHDALKISPNVSVSLVSDDNDISIIRNQCSEKVNDYSWRLIFAKDDADFESIWDDMTAQLDGLGFQELNKFDVEKFAPELEAKKAAAAEAE